MDIQLPWCRDAWRVSHHQFCIRALVLVLLRSNHHFSSCGQTKGKILCDRSGDWVGMCCDFKGALLFPFLHPTNPSLQAREDTSLRICLNNGQHHPEAAWEFPPTSVNSAFGFPVASLDPSFALGVKKSSVGITADVWLAVRKSRPSWQVVLWKSWLPFRSFHPL